MHSHLRSSSLGQSDVSYNRCNYDFFNCLLGTQNMKSDPILVKSVTSTCNSPQLGCYTGTQMTIN